MGEENDGMEHHSHELIYTPRENKGVQHSVHMKVDKPTRP